MDLTAGMGQTTLNVVVLVFSLIAGLVVFMRLFTRGVLLHKTGAEDVWISFAMILSIGLTVTIALQVQNGLGLHIEELTPLMMVDALKAFWASIWMYNLALTATKISVLTQYLRVFPVPRFQMACRITLGFIAVYGLWTCLGNIFLCFPVAFFWDKSIANGKCLNQEAIWFSNASVNITQDLIILFLPMAVLRTLSIPDRQKRALMVIFGIGGLVCVVSIVRLQTLVSIANSPDPTYDNPPAAMLSAIEANVGIICACLPSMRPLLAAALPAYFPDPSSQYTNLKRKQYDEEHPKHLRNPSASTTRPYTATLTHKPPHSRSASAASLPFTPTTPSAAARPNPSRADSASIRHSLFSKSDFRIGSKTSHMRTLSNTSRTPSSSHDQQAQQDQDHELHPLHTPHGVSLPPYACHPHPHPQAPTQAHQHPLHMSPSTPKLPVLPEHSALFSPTDEDDTHNFSPQPPSSTRRIRLFHKPLPITPLPGLGPQSAPQTQSGVPPLPQEDRHRDTDSDRDSAPPSPDLVPAPLDFWRGKTTTGRGAS